MIRIDAATADRVDDLRPILCPGAASPNACWCLTYRLSNTDNNALRGEARPMRLRQLCERPIAPGLIAYVEAEPAGWIAVGPRTDFERLRRSRTLPPIDDLPVWSVVCLVVRARFRRQGVARALIEGAVAYATSQGAQVIEAYPIETQGQRVSASLAFMGTTSLFGAAGFLHCADTRARSAGRPRVIMRRALAATT